MRPFALLLIVAGLLMGVACTAKPAPTPLEVVTLPPSVTNPTPPSPTPLENAAYQWLQANGWEIVPLMLADPRVQEIVGDTPDEWLHGDYWHDHVRDVREAPPNVFATVTKHLDNRLQGDQWRLFSVYADVLVVFEGNAVVDYRLRGIRLLGPDGFIWPPAFEADRVEAARLWAKDNWPQLLELVLPEAREAVDGVLSGKLPDRDRRVQESWETLAEALEVYDPDLISVEGWGPYSASITIKKVVELRYWGPPEAVFKAYIRLTFDNMDSMAVEGYSLRHINIIGQYTEDHPPPPYPTPA